MSRSDIVFYLGFLFSFWVSSVTQVLSRYGFRSNVNLLIYLSPFTTQTPLNPTAVLCGNLYLLNKAHVFEMCAVYVQCVVAWCMYNTASSLSCFYSVTTVPANSVSRGFTEIPTHNYVTLRKILISALLFLLLDLRNNLRNETLKK